MNLRHSEFNLPRNSMHTPLEKTTELKPLPLDLPLRIQDECGTFVTTAL